MQGNEFRLSDNEIRAFEVEQLMYQTKLEASHTEASIFIPISPYEKVMAIGGAGYKDLNFNDPSVHQFLAHELLAHTPIDEWKKHDFVKRFNDAEFRFAVKHNAERNDLIFGKEDTFSLFSGKSVEAITAASGLITPLKIPVAFAKLYKLTGKNGFDYGDLAALESLRPGMFSDNAVRDEFLKGFVLEQDALQYMTGKINEEMPKDTSSSEKPATEEKPKKDTPPKKSSNKKEPKKKPVDQKLKIFAKAYGFNLNDIDLETQKELQELLEKQEASNNLHLFSD